jgi:hypothetical protein
MNIIGPGAKRVENTVTWTSTCAGPPEMAGQGDNPR